MERIIVALGGLIALCCLVMYAVILRAPLIQKDVETRSRQALDESGLGEGIQVEGDGRYVLLKSSSESDDGALEVVQGTMGVSKALWEVVDADNIETAEQELPLGSPEVVEAQPWKTSVVFEDGRFTIDGDRPADSAISRKLLKDLRAKHGFRNVKLTRDGESSELPSYWAASVDSAVSALSKTTGGSAQFVPNNLIIEGTVSNAADQADIKQLLVEQTPENIVWRTQFETLDVEPQVADTDLAVEETAKPSAPEITTVSASACDSAVADHMEGQKIQFKKYKTSVQGTSLELIDGIVEIVATCPTSKIQVRGFTDSRGDAALNERLSLERAESVKQYLLEQGVDEARVDARGFGSRSPIATNKTAEGRATNRRIEFRVIGE